MRLLWIAVLAILVTTLLFSVIYVTMEEGEFESVSADGEKRSLTYNEAWYTAMNAQTLLGMGGVTPKSDTARFFTSTQAFITVVILIALSAHTKE